MNELHIKAALAGISFGIWPLLMNKSGMSGNPGSLVFTFIILLFVIPFGYGGLATSLPHANWLMLVGAGVVSALGLLSFNGMLAKATPQNLRTMFVLMIVVQIATPVVYHVVMNGELSLTKGIGFALAIAAAILLLI